MSTAFGTALINVESGEIRDVLLAESEDEARKERDSYNMQYDLREPPHPYTMAVVKIEVVG
jgi:hypothetical protein